jgi:hypothetical protein
MPRRDDPTARLRERTRALNDAARRRSKAAAGRILILCECGHSACRATVLLDVDEYDEIRATSGWFLVTPGHQREALRAVVRASDRFFVIMPLEHAEAS